MPIAITNGQFDYILDAERELPEEEQTVFVLKVLTFKERAKVSEVKFKQDRRGRVELVTDDVSPARKVLNVGLLGWRNFRDQDGAEVEFRRTDTGLPDETLDLIAPWATELANAITERAGVDRRESKNSS